MKQNWNKIGRVTAKRYDGTIREYNSLADFLRVLGHSDNSDRINARGFLRSLDFDFGVGDQYLVRDEYGLVIPRWRIDLEIERNPPRRWSRYRPPGHEIGGPKYRREHVWGVHKFKPSRRYYRHPHTMNEKRENCFLEFDEDLIERELRFKNRSVVTAWDDLCRSNWNNRSWKKYRNKQHK